MFVSFFPSPRAFFWSAAAWSLIAVLLWFFGASEWGSYIGLPNPPADAPPIIGVSRFWSPPFVWFYIYFYAFVAVFALVWSRLSPHPWFAWSVLGSAFIIFFTYFSVQVSVAINDWYGEFFDLIQKALGTPGSVPAADLFRQFFAIAGILGLFIVIAVFTSFFSSHFVFRWRTAMNDYYTYYWPKLRNIEGASQRVQEDTMRFANMVENLGSNFINAVMTLIAFLPVLARLSKEVSEVPILGAVPYSLVWVAVLWAVFGTGLLALIGIKLPGLEFKNQRVEAAYRKELVYGEDDGLRAAPHSLRDLFTGVRQNYFNLYFNYLYFNVGRYAFLQADSILPFFILIPAVAAGKITLGIFQQVRVAFGEVREATQFLVRSWSSIVELISIYKRLRSFESAIHGETIDPKNEYMTEGLPAQ